MQRLILASLGLLFLTCGGSPSPTSPSTPTTPTPAARTLQSVALSANVSGLTLPGATAQVTATGTFSDGTSQNLTTSCANWQSDTPSVLTVSSGGLLTAHTNGAATIMVTCQGLYTVKLFTIALAAPWTKSGTGDSVFDMPTYVTRVRIIGTYTGYSSNFVVYIGGRLIVNELLGTGWGMTRYDGTLLTGGGGVVEVKYSSGVSWSFTEVR